MSAYGALADSPEAADALLRNAARASPPAIASPVPMESSLPRVPLLRPSPAATLTPATHRARERAASGATGSLTPATHRAAAGATGTAAVSVTSVRLHTAGVDVTGPEWGLGGRASVLASSFNLTCNLIGSGMLAMPWSLKESSLISGCVILCLLSVFNAVSMIVLAKCCDMARSFSYQKIGTRALGARAGVLIQITMLAYTFSSCLSYVILIGDFVPNAVESMRPDRFGLGTSELRVYVILIISVAILMPLSFIRNLYSLRFTSAIAMLAIFYTMAITLQSLHGHLSPMPRDLELWAFPVCSWRALAVMNVAFTAHYNGPRFYQELSARSLPRFALVNAIAMGASLLIYVSIAVAGYWRFSAGVQGDLILNFATDDVRAIVARLSLAIGMAFSFPLCFHSIRTSTFALLFTDLMDPANQTLRSPKYVAVTLVLVGINVILGIVLTQIETVMSYKGSILGCSIVYIFPALMYLALKKRERLRAIRKDAQNRQARFARVAKLNGSERIQEESAQCDSDHLAALAKAAGLKSPPPGASPLTVKIYQDQLAWEQQRAAGASVGMIPESPVMASPDASDSDRLISVSYGYERDALESTDLDVAYYNMAGEHASLPRARESPPVAVNDSSLCLNGPANDAAATLPAGASARPRSSSPSLASLPFSPSRVNESHQLGSYHSISEDDFSMRSGGDDSLLRTVTPSYITGNNFLQNAPTQTAKSAAKGHAQQPSQPIHSRGRRDRIASPVGYRRPNVFVRAWNSVFGPSVRGARSSSRVGASAAASAVPDSPVLLPGALPNTLSFNSPFSIDSTSVDEHDSGCGNDDASFTRDLGLPPHASSRWLTMDSAAFKAFAVFMAAWGIGAGMMGLVINIVVQAGELQQCL